MVVDLAEQAHWAGKATAHPGAMLVGGEWVPAAAGTSLVTADPGSGTFLAEVPLGGATDIDAAVSAARSAFAS